MLKLKTSPPPWRPQPLLYEVNARVWLRELSRNYRKLVTLATVPPSEVEAWASLGIDGIWLMGVWKISRVSQAMAREEQKISEVYGRFLPDIAPSDLTGSPYAVAGYEVEPILGGERGLIRFRQLLHQLGLKLILDFVPNHLALDHPWLFQHPDYFVRGSREESRRDPQTWFRREIRGKLHLFAHGKDPFFPSWRDTVQLNYGSAEVRSAMRQLLQRIASLCDGVRCDMAMLLLNKVFHNTWGERRAGSRKLPPKEEFWVEAVAEVKQIFPNFLFLAEAYWGLEWELQQLGFDYTYDKLLYDRLRDNDLEGVRKHLEGDPSYQIHTCRFLENHDEERSAAIFGPHRSKACALLTATSLGMKLFHDGQFEGRRLKVPVQLSRRPLEEVDGDLQQFYKTLLKETSDPIYHEGEWKFCATRAAPEDEEAPTEIFSSFWRKETRRRLSVINLGKEKAKGILSLPIEALPDGVWQFRDLFGEASFEKPGKELISHGLEIELDAYGFRLFEVTMRAGTVPL